MADLAAFLRDAFGDDQDAIDRVRAGVEGAINRELGDPSQPGQAFWPASVEEHRLLLAMLEAELTSALRTIRSLHRCPSCGHPLTARPGE